MDYKNNIGWHLPWGCPKPMQRGKSEKTEWWENKPDLKTCNMTAKADLYGGCLFQCFARGG